MESFGLLVLSEFPTRGMVCLLETIWESESQRDGLSYSKTRSYFKGN